MTDDEMNELMNTPASFGRPDIYQFHTMVYGFFHNTRSPRNPRYVFNTERGRYQSIDDMIPLPPGLTCGAMGTNEWQHEPIECILTCQLETDRVILIEESNNV